MLTYHNDLAGARSRATRLLAVAFALALLLALARTGNAAAADSHPGWELTTLSAPTNLHPSDAGNEQTGPSLVLIFSNVGGAPTEGVFQVEDTLPAGVSVSAGVEVRGQYEAGNFLEREEPTCSVSGQVVTCVGSAAMVPGAIGQIRIPLQTPATPQTLENEATISGGAANGVRATNPIVITGSEASFDFAPGAAGTKFLATDASGDADTLAGSHPFQTSIGFGFNTKGAPGGEFFATDGGVKDVRATLPKGFVVNPQATPRLCTESELENPGPHFTSCPRSSQVGSVTIRQALVGTVTAASYPLYSMVSPPGSAAELGFPAVINGIYIHILGRLNSAGQYELAADSNDIAAKTTIVGIEVNLWGNPSDPAHDSLREACATHGGTPEEEEANCSPGGSEPFLTMPSHCGPAGTLGGMAASWDHPTNFLSASTLTADANGEPVGTDGCNQLAFEPTISSQPTTNLSDSPSGLEFNLHQPQNGAIEGRSTATLENARVTLPAGLSINPAGANGLGACSEEQIGLTSNSPVHFNEASVTCPTAAKVGSLEVKTPLLDHELSGAVYVAQPFENPFGSLLAIYLAVEDERTGIVAKLAGKVETDPGTGQLTATFTENPELPIEDIDLHFFQGTGAVLKTPLACGTHTTSSTLTPWSSPEGADVHPSDSFQTTVPASPGSCPESEAGAPNAPAFSAGTLAPEAGTFSPFSLRIVRADGTQQIQGIDTTLPGGLTGKLAGVPYCSEGAIALARSREVPNQGKVEQASPSCPVASEIGTVEVGAGAGITPYYASGHAYLAGPYKGAPLSMVVIVPAVAGPFDLGAVVNRIALYVGEYSAQIHAVSDPLPTIREGIPLDVRSIELKLNRPSFTINPTSCEQMAITGTATSPTGSVAALNNSFQVGGCKKLAFKPKLKLSLKGSTKRTGHPALKAVLTFPSKGTSANIAKAQVGLPHGEFLDNAHIGTVCTQPQLKAQACPAGSIYGKAKAWTPLLDKPLEGPVYLGTGFGHKLPDLVADLNGQIRVLVHGKVDTDKQHGIRNTFEAVPDAPVSRFVLEMKGGKKGLLVNSENTCKTPQNAEASFTAQNGKVLSFKAPIDNGCKTGKKGKGGKKRGGKHHR